MYPPTPSQTSKTITIAMVIKLRSSRRDVPKKQRHLFSAQYPCGKLQKQQPLIYTSFSQGLNYKRQCFCNLYGLSIFCNNNNNNIIDNLPHRPFRQIIFSAVFAMFMILGNTAIIIFAFFIVVIIITTWGSPEDAIITILPLSRYFPSRSIEAQSKDLSFSQFPLYANSSSPCFLQHQQDFFSAKGLSFIVNTVRSVVLKECARHRQTVAHTSQDEGPWAISSHQKMIISAQRNFIWSPREFRLILFTRNKCDGVSQPPTLTYRKLGQSTPRLTHNEGQYVRDWGINKRREGQREQEKGSNYLQHTSWDNDHRKFSVYIVANPKGHPPNRLKFLSHASEQRQIDTSFVKEFRTIYNCDKESFVVICLLAFGKVHKMSIPPTFPNLYYWLLTIG